MHEALPASFRGAGEKRHPLLEMWHSVLDQEEEVYDTVTKATLGDIGKVLLCYIDNLSRAAIVLT
jgi:hypothetical protein